MTQALGVEQAFQDLEHASPVLQGLLRPVLVRALQDPALMRQLGSAALSQHLSMLGEILTSMPAQNVGSQPPPRKTYVHLAGGEAVEDVEDAYRFAESLEAPLRTRVEAGLSQAFQLAATGQGQGGVSLLALARLLALAFSNRPFVEHVLLGGPIEPFLPTEGGASVSFVGELVEVVALVGEQDSGEARHVFVSVGRVLELSPTHVLLETLREDERPGSRLLLALAHIVSMRTLSTDSSSRSFRAG